MTAHCISEDTEKEPDGGFACPPAPPSKSQCWTMSCTILFAIPGQRLQTFALLSTLKFGGGGNACRACVMSKCLEPVCEERTVGGIYSSQSTTSLFNSGDEKYTPPPLGPGIFRNSPAGGGVCGFCGFCGEVGMHHPALDAEWCMSNDCSPVAFRCETLSPARSSSP